jgi:hypothetical protein
VTGYARSVAQYRIRRIDQPRMVERLKAITAGRRRFAYPRLDLGLEQLGHMGNIG